MGRNASASLGIFFVVVEIIVSKCAFVFRHSVTCCLYYVHRYLRLTIPYALTMAGTQLHWTCVRRTKVCVH